MQKLYFCRKNKSSQMHAQIEASFAWTKKASASGPSWYAIWQMALKNILGLQDIFIFYGRWCISSLNLTCHLGVIVTNAYSQICTCIFEIIIGTSIKSLIYKIW